MSELICIALLLFQFVFLLRLVMSFFPIATGSMASTVRDSAVALTDPVVLPIRRRVPPLPGVLAGFGVAELIVLLVLVVAIGVFC